MDNTLGSGDVDDWDRCIQGGCRGFLVLGCNCLADTLDMSFQSR